MVSGISVWALSVEVLFVFAALPVFHVLEVAVFVFLIFLIFLCITGRIGGNCLWLEYCNTDSIVKFDIA